MTTGKNNTILVTGGCGYIGSHIVHALLDQGKHVAVLDNLHNSHSGTLPANVQFFEVDILDRDSLEDVFAEIQPAAVIHMAALISVEESVANPDAYFSVNTQGTQNVVDACVKYKVHTLIFSSTAAVYAANENALTETAPFGPASPYGQSKLDAEKLIREAVDHSDLKAVILRYFNVAGADPKGRTGQRDAKTTHLIARACQAASGKIPEFQLYGDDYNTKDGTPIRDFIHVSDLADIHCTVLNKNFQDNLCIFNCGYGSGYSVKQIIDMVKSVTATDFPVTIKARRPGDLPQLIADNDKLRKTTGWMAQHNDIRHIVSTAWNWYRRENT
jgi:UDP-glucose 4-epimerase